MTFGESGTVSWHGSTGTFAGTFSAADPVSGNNVNITITGSGIASGCTYHAAGTVANGVLDGTYSQSGAQCIDKSGAGRFHLVQGVSITTVVCGPYSYSGPSCQLR